MKTTRETPGPRYLSVIEVFRATERLWNASRVFLERWDLSPSQFNILNLLNGTPEGLTQSQLSRELIVHRSNITGLIDRLEARGLVVRKDSEGDRRSWTIHITPEGEALMRQVLPSYYAAAESLWEGFPEGRAEQWVKDLHFLTENAETIARGDP